MLYYSGSNSHDNVNKEVEVSNATRALQTSHLQKRPIRVLRSAGEAAKWSPSVGVRYDGLYHITDQKICENANFGGYLRFKLVRAVDQEPIDLQRPNTGERRIFERLSKQI